MKLSVDSINFANIFANELFATFLNYEIKTLAVSYTLYTTWLISPAPLTSSKPHPYIS